MRRLKFRRARECVAIAFNPRRLVLSLFTWYVYLPPHSLSYIFMTVAPREQQSKRAFLIISNLHITHSLPLLHHLSLSVYVLDSRSRAYLQITFTLSLSLPLMLLHQAFMRAWDKGKEKERERNYTYTYLVRFWVIIALWKINKIIFTFSFPLMCVCYTCRLWKWERARKGRRHSLIISEGINGGEMKLRKAQKCGLRASARVKKIISLSVMHNLRWFRMKDDSSRKAVSARCCGTFISSFSFCFSSFPPSRAVNELSSLLERA